MERVVYILGAGFSAPLGIPVVRDFLIRAKDLYFGTPLLYAHFEPVLTAIGKLANVKNYLDADLYDIEEVFSIIEMQKQLGVSVPDFAKFISDVVVSSTPPMPNSPPMQNGGHIWGNSAIWKLYGSFALALARMKLTSASSPYSYEVTESSLTYDVITLNYDRALETPLTRLGERLGTGKLYHRPSTDEAVPKNSRLAILKLHGDAAEGTIVPPTWDKSVRDGVRQDWAEAYKKLSQANHVRVLGYSFPPTDTYFRYFLKASLANTQHLKSLDILTRDADGQVKQRCDSTFTFKFKRFREFEAQGYLQSTMANGIEKAHAAFAG